MMKLMGLLAALVFSGCSGIGIVKEKPFDWGTKVSFNVEAKLMKKAATQSLTDNGFKIEEKGPYGKNRWQVTGFLGSSMQSWGQYLRIVVLPVSNESSQAYVYNAARISMNVTEPIQVMRTAVIESMKAHALALEE